MEERRLMKDGLGAAAVARIGAALAKAAPGFDRRAFERDANRGLAPLELKQRVHHVIAALARHLPADFDAAAAALRKVPAVWDRGAEGDPLRGFAAWPLIDYVGVHGLDRPALALETLRELTPLFTAEFAVRPFFVRHYDLTYAAAMAWAKDPSEHVRRLASEGARPRLPWGLQLKCFIADPAPLVPLLDALKDDPSDMVRRSVANNLNDVSKDHPDVVVGLARRWLASPTPERAWIVKHATRTLVKKGHPATLALLGFGAKPRVRLEKLTVTPRRVAPGGTVAVAGELVSTAKAPQTLVVDFAMHFMKASGAQKPKVFKGRKVALAPGARVAFRWTHAFRKITTRKHYAGEHRLQIVANGRVLGDVVFDLR